MNRRGWSLMSAAALVGLAVGGRQMIARAADPAVATPPPSVNAPNGTPVKDLMKGAISDAAKGVVQGAMNRTAQAAGTVSAAGAAAVAVPQPVAAPPPADPAARAALLRRKALRDEDFAENEEGNRDPFRSYLRLFVEKQVQQVRKVPAIFDKFALEELTLIGIISGDANPRAMFRDPGGLGQTVKRGDYLSKTGARVTKILSDRIILELSETTPTGDARPLEKAVFVNPEESQK